MMKKKKQFEKWANDICSKSQKVLLLEHFSLNPIEYNDKKPEVSTCQFSYPYQTITIHYSKFIYEDWEKGKFEQAKGTLIHEVVHALTDGLYCKSTNRYVTKDEIEDEREKLTDHVAQLLIYHKLIK